MKIDRKDDIVKDIIWKYIKPLKDIMIIKKFENENKFNIPKELKDCILINNGGRPNLKNFDTNKSKGRVIKTLLSYNKDDIENIYKVIPLLKEDIMNLLPFASDPSGNLVCIDLNDNNSVVFWQHETNKIEYISDSFTKFLESLYN